MLTGTTPDCGPQPSGTSPALKWSVIALKLSGKRGSAEFYSYHNRIFDKNTSTWAFKNNYFLTSCLKFKKIQRTFLQE
jgi:hypothetical protein